MEASAFNRFIRASPDKYKRGDMQLLSKYIRDQELYARITGGIGEDYDYGYAGEVDERGHLTDAGKLPWHPTFSNQSAFVTEENPGGIWGHDSGGDTFEPTDRMKTKRFYDYMKHVEPNVRIK